MTGVPDHVRARHGGVVDRLVQPDPGPSLCADTLPVTRTPRVLVIFHAAGDRRGLEVLGVVALCPQTGDDEAVRVVDVDPEHAVAARRHMPKTGTGRRDGDTGDGVVHDHDVLERWLFPVRRMVPIRGSAVA